MGTLQVHVDVDNFSVYENEFAAPGAAGSGYIYERALPNALALFERYGIKATFFIAIIL